MHQRQAGAAHVNIFFFLIMLVLFLGAVFFAYVNVEENNKLRQDIAEANRQRNDATGRFEMFQHYVEDLSGQVGETDDYRGRNGWKYSVNDQLVTSEDAAIDSIKLTAASNPEKVSQSMNTLATAVGVAATKGLTTLFDRVVSKFNEQKATIAGLQSERTNLTAQITQLQAANAAVERDKSTEITALNGQIRQNTSTYQGDISQREGTINAQNQQYQQLAEQMSTQQREHADVVAGLRKDKSELQARIEAAANKARLINPAQSPDGMVLEASQATGLAWIDLGRRDMLPIGATFEILAGDGVAVKAYGTVTKVEQTRAEMRVTGLSDRFDPVTRGDRVRNDLYSAGLKHNIYLLGRFGEPYSRPLVKSLLENLGNTVMDELPDDAKLPPTIDLIILGADETTDDGFRPLAEDEHYQQAQFLRIDMVPLSRVRQYLRLNNVDND